MIDFQIGNELHIAYDAHDAPTDWGVSGGEPRSISLRARPAHTLTYPWPGKIPYQLRSPKDIIKAQ